MKYYVITALLTGPASIFVIMPLYFKYETLRYRFDEEGMSMSWGILMRRQTSPIAAFRISTSRRNFTP
jgi:putative membrane protein